MNTIERIKSPTPKFFRRLQQISLVCAGIAGTILASPVGLPVVVVTVAGYVALAGGVAAAISQLSVEEKNPKPEDDGSA